MQKSKLKLTIFLLGISHVVLLVALAFLMSNGGLFQARLNLPVSKAPQEASSSIKCQSLKVLSIPSAPLPPDTSAFISIQAVPEKFQGIFSYSASSGTLNDLKGNANSFIETEQTEVGFSGGSKDSTITIQALGEGNEQCIATLEIVAPETIACTSLSFNVYPSPLPPEQSAEMKLVTQPPHFNGSYLLQSETGTFQTTDADDYVAGNRTTLLVTKSKTFLFSGGKPNEKIVARALGEKNEQCTATFQVNKK